MLLLALCVALTPAMATGQTSSEPDAGWVEDSAPEEQWEEEPPGELAPAFDEYDADPRALSEFRPVLDAYGYWVQDARYGLVWVPDRSIVGADFAPYSSHGRWRLDTHGNWVWYSDFAFGPVVFHYGRWVWIAGVGWSWVPGYRYAPAWVQWRVPVAGAATVGWAPLPPSFIWIDGVALGVGFYVTTPWLFCPSAYVFHHHPYRYRVRGHDHMRHAADHTRHYHGHGHKNGPTPFQAGVPKHRQPKVRVPAQPVPRPARAGLPERRGGWASPSSYESVYDMLPREQRILPGGGRATPRAEIRRPERDVTGRRAPPAVLPRALRPLPVRSRQNATQPPVRSGSASPAAPVHVRRKGTTRAADTESIMPARREVRRVVGRVKPRSSAPRVLPRAPQHKRLPANPKPLRRLERSVPRAIKR